MAAHIPDDTAEHAYTETRNLLHNAITGVQCSEIKFSVSFKRRV
jgi:hypothetical protein